MRALVEPKHGRPAASVRTSASAGAGNLDPAQQTRGEQVDAERLGSDAIASAASRQARPTSRLAPWIALEQGDDLAEGAEQGEGGPARRHAPIQNARFAALHGRRWPTAALDREGGQGRTRGRAEGAKCTSVGSACHKQQC